MPAKQLTATTYLLKLFRPLKALSSIVQNPCCWLLVCANLLNVLLTRLALTSSCMHLPLPCQQWGIKHIYVFTSDQEVTAHILKAMRTKKNSVSLPDGVGRLFPKSLVSVQKSVDSLCNLYRKIFSYYNTFVSAYNAINMDY